MSDLSPKSFTKRIAGKVKGFFKQPTTTKSTAKTDTAPKRVDKLPGNKLSKILKHIYAKIVLTSEDCWCGKALSRNNPKQVVHFCCKLHHWARHNKKYLLTARGHK